MTDDSPPAARLSRRGLASLPLLALAAAARAEEAFPSRPVSLTVPAAPGGTADIAARALAEPLSRALGKPVVVENKPGAATQLGTAAVARAAPDGHSLLVVGAPFAVNPALFPSLPYEPRRDFAPVTLLVRNGLFLLVPEASPARDLAGLLALARSKGGLNTASPGNGSMSHMSLELLASRSGAPLVHVPYRGTGPALPDLVAGNVDAMFDDPASALPLVRDGRLRAIAFSAGTRSEAMPEVPTIAETPGLEGFATGNWFALLAPAGVPAPILARLNAEATAALSGLRDRFARDGVEVAPMSRAALGEFLEREMTVWAEVVKERGLKPG
ncbi:tripartite tricarboxylate transporter substrate binding protein [Roseomonas sp. OT10]|uniref:tripartite tricarboxylate transporter substrate binding protein n=1 Tax=Roseomonas cutis TaxID=2897332 RepID=UPI001E2B7E77|nr:tripartite tricarboxylate transporter substrate binding protein [Roseomonas sp. OT10]UFN51210.1 tripartite tricarboxylate transporter substrate binding protein [Roseomonas sp. OT10]